MRQPGTEKIEKIFDKMSSRYDRDIGFIERLIFDGARSWAVSQARGEVIEIGVGTGLNLPLYGPAVTQVIGVDLSEGMLGVARKRVTGQQLDGVELRHGDVQTLDLPDDSADTVVSTLTFCSIPDPLIASRQAYRVLRPGGRFVLAEHGPSTSAIGCAVMRAIEPLTTRFLADHLTRDPVPYLKEAGLTVDEVHRGGRGGIMFRVLAHKDHG
ncbi:MAG: class I SAM-dependent methyltransferase [Actinobacteria bacterium]|nr:class I SAM-dependent methyltransferase [Actinomycetota bacterium]